MPLLLRAPLLVSMSRQLRLTRAHLDPMSAEAAAVWSWSLELVPQLRSVTRPFSAAEAAPGSRTRRQRRVASAVARRFASEGRRRVQGMETSITDRGHHTHRLSATRLSPFRETRGFASLPHDRFAFIG